MLRQDAQSIEAMLKLSCVRITGWHYRSVAQEISCRLPNRSKQAVAAFEPIAPSGNSLKPKQNIGLLDFDSKDSQDTRPICRVGSRTVFVQIRKAIPIGIARRVGRVGRIQVVSQFPFIGDSVAIRIQRKNRKRRS